MTQPSAIVVPQRFRGPPSSGNGGWTAGAIACATVPGTDNAAPWPAVTVSLHLPPPLDTELTVTREDDVTVVTYGDQVVGRARLADHDLTEVPPVPIETARAASAGYRGLVSHPFPSCFACGVGREEGDGLRIFPGDVAGDDLGRVAATWTPDPSVVLDGWSLRSERSERLEAHDGRDSGPHASVPVTWAALDCVGGWSTDIEERAMVLGTMTLRLDALPRIGEEHVVVGAMRGGEGRKTFTGATMYDASGAVVATAEHVWITVDPADFA